MPGRYAAQGAEGDAQPGSRGRVLANRLGIIRVGEMQAAESEALLSLTGALGGSSSALGSVLANPVATLGAGLVLPFLNQTEMRTNAAIAQTDYERAVVQFRQTLYQALADVDNALSARRQYAEQAVQLEQSLADARRAERLYEVRYRAGAVALKPWLDAQEKRRNAEIALAENRLNRLVNHATLYQALGGT